MIITKFYEEPHFCEKEILRYSGGDGNDKKTAELVYSTIDEVKGKLSYKVCYGVFELPTKDGIFDIDSKIFKRNTNECHSLLVFAATVGVEIDRLIAKYGRIFPSRALIMQAIGAERIEALCDTFCNDFEKENGVYLSSRFSPGYGDLSLSVQQEIFDVLNCQKHIGLTLNGSLLMSPSKSVTAFAGISDKKIKNTNNKCAMCNKTDCAYRGAI